MVVTGETEEADQGRATQAVKAQLAFYGSTPAYKPVLEHHGWGDLQPELNTLSKRGEWDDRWRTHRRRRGDRVRRSRRARRNPLDSFFRASATLSTGSASTRHTRPIPNAGSGSSKVSGAA